MHLKIQFHSGQSEKHPLEEGRSYLIGRGRKADIQVNEEGISREHFRIDVTSEGVFVVDLGSANGVYVDDEKIDSNKKIEFPDFFPVIAGRNIRFMLERLEDDDKTAESIQARFSKRLNDKRTETQTTNDAPPKGLTIRAGHRKKQEKSLLGSLMGVGLFLGVAIVGLYVYDPSFFKGALQDTMPLAKEAFKESNLPVKQQSTANKDSNSVESPPVATSTPRPKKNPRDIKLWIKLVNSQKCSSEATQKLCQNFILPTNQKLGFAILNDQLFLLVNIVDIQKKFPKIPMKDELGEKSMVLRPLIERPLIEALLETQFKALQVWVIQKAARKPTRFFDEYLFPRESWESLDIDNAVQSYEHIKFDDNYGPFIDEVSDFLLRPQ